MTVTLTTPSSSKGPTVDSVLKSARNQLENASSNAANASKTANITTTKNENKTPKGSTTINNNKTPKRASVTTLLSLANTSNSASSSQSTENTKHPTKAVGQQVTKPAKRVTATTLLTFDKTDEKSKVNQLICDGDQEILKSPVEVKSPLPEPATGVVGNPLKPPTTPKSLNRTHAQTPPKGSPNNNRPPKRVHVTTLTTFKTTATDTNNGKDSIKLI